MLEFGTFARAVNDRPYKWMTIGGQKKDGDCHEVVRYFIAMTGNSTNSQFVVLLRKAD